MHWLALGIIIPYVSWNVAPWLKGLVLAELLALPIIAMVIKEDARAWLPISLFSAALGAMVGRAGSLWV